MSFPIARVHAPQSLIAAGSARRVCLSLWPVSGLTTYRPRLPTRDAQWHTREFSMNSRSGSTCMTHAVAYRCGGSAGWRVRANATSCFPFNRACGDARAKHQSAGSLGASSGAVKNGRSVLFIAGYCPMRGLAFVITSIKARTKRGCYVSKRDNYRNLRHYALKCDVFRGRSTCSPNSNHFHKISAS